jgi:hypothetical protein
MEASLKDKKKDQGKGLDSLGFPKRELQIHA